MSLTDRYAAYAADFEKTYEDDDWSRLEQYFTDDAVYKSDDAPFVFNAEGRGAVLAYLKNAIDGFDRKMGSRALEMLEGPTETGNEVWIRWRATYTCPGAPDVSMEGTETATFQGDRIQVLVDTFDAAAAAKVVEWMQEHAAKLQGG